MFVLALFSYLNLQNGLILGFVFLLTYWYLRTRTPPNLPPGPWALPVLGNVAQIFTKAPYKLWMKLAKEYGPVIYLWLGSQQIVVLNTYSAIHEALVKKGEDFSNRPALHTFKQMGLTNNGIVLLPYGPFFKQQRKFTIMGLRDFGFGKRSLEGKIVEESQELREEILKKGQKPFNIRRMLQNAVGNVICSIVLGKRFEYDDEKLEKIMRAFDQNTGDQRLSRMADFFPWARHIPVIKRAVAKYVKDVERCVGIFREDIAAHKETFDPNDIRDFIDTFLLEMKNKEGEEGNDFTDRQLEYLIRDLFLAGEESTSNTLNWALLYMLRHPDVQEKVQQEIDSTIGQDVTPSFSHRGQLPYTEAVTMEVMRINPIAPLSAIHATSNDTTLYGYNIPKEAIVFTNLWAVLHDPEVYPEPDSFKPERFLDDKGQCKKGDTFIPFSLGKRACPGDHLGRMELFLLFTSLMQHFTFKLPEGAPLPSTQGQRGITNNAVAFELCAIPRQ
ncbi:PREDICTED: cytochrome P450 2J1-like [Branchiostoma belcheri]|uniref:Cytochrome P450 2U1 n=1 Tax=Branchiostoma belcheri TaxID=7741 RepID=A0A6P4YFT1_BRABE|nr:PREDICTED: cytochrome P450 2J1-like [Branchiostoma belcheri]